MSALIGFAAGLLFGVGLIVSRMTDPAVVLAFLDVAGAWNPSLLFVMAGAAGTFGVVYVVAVHRGRAILAPELRLPVERPLDHRLFVGTTLFGVGWGLVGLCPGPAIVSLAGTSGSGRVFAAAMVAGILTAGTDAFRR